MQDKCIVTKVAYIEKDQLDFEGCSSILDNLPEYKIKNDSWPEYETVCHTNFSIAHMESAILLKYRVKNDFFKTRVSTINGAVNKDNCVEFFIQFNEEQPYYNIEFNCLGIGKMAYGTNRNNRQLLAKDDIKKIRVWYKLHDYKVGFNWEIILYIPLEVFCFQQIHSFTGLSCPGNFFKCGDDLPVPHYLSWNKVQSKLPDFHLPEFFGTIDFL